MGMKRSLRVNGVVHELDVDARMPLLWVLRDELDLVGTKYGCGIGACGACTVLVGGIAVRACTIELADVDGEVATIEGLGTVEAPHPLQAAWIEHQVAQCGYCQPGQIMAAVSLLRRNPQPEEGDIDRAMSPILCRCGTYPRIRAAIRTAADEARRERGTDSSAG